MTRTSRRVAGSPRGRRGVASVGVVAIAASVLTYAAVTSQGSTVHEADVGESVFGWNDGCYRTHEEEEEP